MDRRETAEQIQKCLPDTRGKVLQELLARKPEAEIASELNITAGTLRKHVALLYDDFRELLPSKEPGQRNNMRELLSLFSEQSSSPLFQDYNEIYIPHPEIEARCYEVIQRPGGLLRIEAPLKMGKTTLLNRCLKEISEKSFRTVSLNVSDETQPDDLKDLDSFLQWFCFSIAAELNINIPLKKPAEIAAELKAAELKAKIDAGLKIDTLSENPADIYSIKPEKYYWDNILFGNPIIKSKKFFEKHILNELLVVGFDDLERIYDKKDIVSDFLLMLHCWHELGINKRNKWDNLRLILTYIEEFPFDDIDINSSPFNVGECVEIPELNRQQVKDLFQQSNINLGTKYIDKITDVFGGNPYLLKRWVQEIKTVPIDLARKIIESDKFKKEFQELTKDFEELEQLKKESRKETQFTSSRSKDIEKYINKSNEISRGSISQFAHKTKNLLSPQQNYLNSSGNQI